MRLYTLTLPAGEHVSFAITGNYFRVITAPAEFEVFFSGPDITTDIMAGLGIRLERDFQTVRLYSVTGQTVKIMAGRGMVDDSRLAGEVDLSGALQMLQTSAATVAQGVATVTDVATLVSAANLDRRAILLQVEDTAAGAVFYGSTAGVTVATGIKIAIGGVMTLENAQPVYLIAGAGVSVSVRYLEEIN